MRLNRSNRWISGILAAAALLLAASPGWCPNPLVRRRAIGSGLPPGMLAVGAASFNGATPTFLETPSTSDFQVATHDFSLCLWYYVTNATPGTYQRIFIKGGGSGTTDEWGIQINGTTNQLSIFYCYNPGYSGVDIGALSANSWHFAYAGWSQGSQLFSWSIDHAAVSTAGGSAFGPQATTNPVFLGVAGDGVTSPYTGLLDGVGFWTRLLTPAELTQLWNGGRGVKMKNLSGSILTGLTAGYDLDGPAVDGLWHDAINAHQLTNHSGVVVVPGKT